MNDYIYIDVMMICKAHTVFYMLKETFAEVCFNVENRKCFLDLFDGRSLV